MATLIGLSYSPWTRKARWALDHHGLSYTFVEHLPMLGEPLLRWKLRRWRAPVTVPAFIDKGARLMDSCTIARHAEHQAPPDNKKLFPHTHRDAIDGWNQCAERLMRAGRGLVVSAVLGSEEAILASAPPPFSKSERMRAASRPLVAMGVKFIARKYGTEQTPAGENLGQMRQELSALRAALADGRPYVMGEDFTFADVAMWAALEMVSPSASSPLPVAVKTCWTRPELCADFPDLLAWRDQIETLRPQRR